MLKSLDIYLGDYETLETFSILEEDTVKDGKIDY